MEQAFGAADLLFWAGASSSALRSTNAIGMLGSRMDTDLISLAPRMGDFK
jgi:hypothetical protein